MSLSAAFRIWLAIGAAALLLLVGYCAGSAGRSEQTGKAKAAEVETKRALAVRDSAAQELNRVKLMEGVRIREQQERADSADHAAAVERGRTRQARARADSLGAVVDHAAERVAAAAGDSTATLEALDTLMATSGRRVSALTAALDASERHVSALEVRVSAGDSILASVLRREAAKDDLITTANEALARAIAEAGSWKAARASWLERHLPEVAAASALVGWAAHGKLAGGS